MLQPFGDTRSRLASCWRSFSSGKHLNRSTWTESRAYGRGSRHLSETMINQLQGRRETTSGLLCRPVSVRAPNQKKPVELTGIEPVPSRPIRSSVHNLGGSFSHQRDHRVQSGAILGNRV